MVENKKTSIDFVDEMINTILKHEGGFVNDPDDAGGATNYGVTIGTYRRYVNRRATIDDIKNMSKNIAREIYRQQYYYSPKIDKLPEVVQPQVFDMGVNAGPNRAIKIYQQCIGAKADGVIGPKTAKLGEMAIKNGWHPNEYVKERVEFYIKLVKRNRTQEKFLMGWTKRALSFWQEYRGR